MSAYAAIKNAWEKLKLLRSGRIFSRQIKDILQRVDSMQIIDNHTADEILGYDEHGLPR
jgi:hypothetical protein